MGKLCLSVVVVLLLLVSGCGKGKENDGDVTPTAVLSPITSVQSGNITVEYLLKSYPGDRLDVAVEYTLDGGVSYQSCTRAPGGEDTMELFASRYGVEHTFVWNSLDNIAGNVDNVTVRVTPSYDSEQGNAGDTGVFAVHNAGPVGAPTVIVSAPTSGQSGNITVDFTIFDAESDNVTVLVEFNGGSWIEAACGYGGNCAGVLATSPTGITYTFAWNSVDEFGGVGVSDAADVRIRITASQGDISSTPIETDAFSVANSSLTPRDLIELGIEAIKAENPKAAGSFFGSAKNLAASGSQEYNEASFYEAALNVGLSLSYGENGPNPNAVDSLKEILDAFNLSQEGRTFDDLSQWSADFPRDADGRAIIPDNAPSPEVITRILAPEMTASLNAFAQAIADLGDSFTMEIVWEIEPGVEEAVTFDHGDFLLISSGVYLVLHTIKYIEGYNLNVPLAQLQNVDSAYQFRHSYPNFFSIDNAAKLEEARQHMITALNNFLSGIDWIKQNRENAEEGHLFVIDFNQIASSESVYNEIRDRYITFRDSVVNGVRQMNLGDPETPGDDKFVRVNAKAFYSCNWARLCPPIDQETDEPLFEQMTDPTIGGIFPDYTTAKLVHDMRCPVKRNIPRASPVLGGTGWPSTAFYEDLTNDAEGPSIITNRTFPFTISGVDIQRIYACHNNSYLYFRLDLVNSVNTAVADYWLDIDISNDWDGVDDANDFWSHITLQYDYWWLGDWYASWSIGGRSISWDWGELQVGGTDADVVISGSRIDLRIPKTIFSPLNIGVRPLEIELWWDGYNRTTYESEEESLPSFFGTLASGTLG
jgi:hypothetical protein